MASKPFCECEAGFCPHKPASCSNPPVGKADVITFHLNLCNDCFKRHSEFSPGEVHWLRLGVNASQQKTADYEGWTNWETWNVALLIDNEEGSSNLARQMAKNALEKRNQGQLNLDELIKQYAKTFSRQERQVRKYHADMAADARDERGKYESQQLEGKPGLTREEVAALPSEERVKYIGDQLGGIFYDMGGTSGWENPMEPVNWKEITIKFLDDEQNESDYQAEHNGETPEVNPLSDADRAELKAMGITGSKKAMITSDTQLETMKPVPAGEAPKDDIEINSHPADGEAGAPVLDGELHHTEPVDTKQEEVKEEKAKEVTVDKGSGTQIIINIAGKQKKLTFSNQATADAFVKGASAKFGDKFKVAAEEITLKPGDHISWHLHQFSNESRYGTVLDVLPKNPDGLVIFDATLEDLMGNEKGMEVWGYMGLVYEINGQQVKPIEPYAATFEVIKKSSNSPQQDIDNHKPVTTDAVDINAAGPSFKGAGSLFESTTDKTTHWPEIVKGNWVDTPQHRGFKDFPGIYILLPGSNSAYGNTEGGFQSVEQAETYNRMSLGDKGKVHVHGGGALKGATVKTAKNCTICGKPVVLSPSAIERAKRHGGAPSDYTNLFDAHADCQLAKRKQDTSELIKKHYSASDSLDKAENIEHLQAQDEAAQDKKYAIYTGPTLVKQVAKKLVEAGFLLSNLGTERVYVITDQGVDAILAVLGPTWKNRDIQEMPRRRQDDAAFQRSMKEAASLPPEEYKLCFRLSRELGVSYGEAVDAFLKFPDKPLNMRYEYARDKLQKEAPTMAKSAGFNYFFPGQVLDNFYPELMHEIVESPNSTNSPMPSQMTGDAFEVEPGQLEDAVDDAFTGLSVVGYVSTSPAGGMGIARDGKPQVLEGAPLRKENDIRGPMFTDEFYQNYEGVPGDALNVMAHKVAAAEEKQQFALFLKRVMGEIAAAFVYAFKCTSRMPLNKVPGVGEVQLAQIEKPVDSAFNIVNLGSRVKYLLDKLTDSEIQDAINGAWSQGAVWNDSPEGGFVYEVFVRAETIDTESMILSYRFVTGTREAE